MSTWKKATVNIDNYTTQIVYKQRIKMIKRVLNLLLIALVLVASNACSSKGEITVASYNVRYDNREIGRAHV